MVTELEESPERTVGRLQMAAKARGGDELVPVTARELLSIINSFWAAQKQTTVQDAKIDRVVDLLLSAHVRRGR